jgi:hypothetical protein
MRRTFTIGACTAALVGLGVTPAAADDDDHGGSWPEGRGEYEPAPPEYYEQEVTFEACDGETFTITGGDVQEAKFRSTELEDGRILDEYLGPETVDITRDDGVVLDELEVGGYSRTLVTPLEDGRLRIKEQLFGESLSFPFSPEDSEAFIDAFGTDLAYWEDEDDRVTLTLIIEDPESEESLPEIVDIRIRADYIDLCEVFDALAEEEDEDDGESPENEH